MPPHRKYLNYILTKWEAVAKMRSIDRFAFEVRDLQLDPPEIDDILSENDYYYSFADDDSDTLYERLASS